MKQLLTLLIVLATGLCASAQDLVLPDFSLQSASANYGEADIKSAPSKADIYVDNQSYGQTPQILDHLTTGQHLLRISKEGFEDYDATITINENRRTTVNAKLKKAPKQVTIAVRNNPAASNTPATATPAPAQSASINDMLQSLQQQTNTTLTEVASTYQATETPSGTSATAGTASATAGTASATAKRMRGGSGTTAGSRTSAGSMATGATTIDDFFPVWGITIGSTTWKDAESQGYTVEKYNNSRFAKVGPKRVAKAWDHGSKGRFMNLSMFNDSNAEEFPPEWKSKGFAWELSYDAWLRLFRQLGLKVTIVKAPTTKEFSGRQTLSAEIKATTADGLVEFAMDFGYGKHGYTTSSPRTLYWLRVRYLGQ